MVLSPLPVGGLEMGRIYNYLILFLFCIGNDPSSVLGQDSTGFDLPENIDLSEFSLEELMDVEVISISRKSESIQSAAAAIFVISAEDIRRSGAHSIPEVLRLAPGLNVARINSSSWAITSRGFNSRFANKLQVLVDGRSIYSPMFSGVYWEDSSVMLEDIERIEIIRGPGATMWGANAVNGIINIITQKPNADDPSSMVTMMGGTQELFRSAGHLDGASGEAGAWRLSAKYQKNNAFSVASGEEGYDAWDEKLVRFRWDQSLGQNNDLTITGHYFQGDLEAQYLYQTPEPPYSQVENNLVDFETASAQTIWTRKFSSSSSMTLGLNFTHFHRHESLLKEMHNIVDVDFQHHFMAASQHEFIWGGTWRLYHDRLNGSQNIYFNPDSVDGRVLSAFVQDKWNIVPGRFNLVTGLKLEYRKDTGSQWQPNIRGAWTPTKNATWWTSFSRAVRVPSRINMDVQMDMTMLPPGAMFPGSPVTSISMVGSRSMQSEELLAYETGFRYKLNEKVHLDLALFVNQYDKLRILEMGEMQPHPAYDLPVMMIPFIVGNGSGGRTQGGELATRWNPGKTCRFQLAYSYWDYKEPELHSGEDSGLGRMATPKHQISMRGLFNPMRNWEADFWFRFTDDLMADPNGMSEWNELDLRLAWTPLRRLQIAAGGQNLLHDNHQEFIYNSSSPNPAIIERSGYLEFRWNF